MQLKELDFLVIKEQMDSNGVKTPFYCTKRTDNDEFLGVVGKNYPIIQNEQLLDICQKLCNQTGYEIYLEKSIDKGKKVLLSMLCGKVKVGDDIIASQISVANSHTGTTSISFSILDDTIRCSNRFFKVLSDNRLKFNHDSFMFEKIENMIKSISILNDYQKTHYNNLQRFVSTPLSKDLALKMLASELNLQYDVFTMGLKDLEDISTRKKNQFEKLVDCYEIEQSDLNETVYTGYNAITRYSTHILNQPFNGIGLKMSNNIFNNCLNLV